MTRYTLDPPIAQTLRRMAKEEQRSMANMVSVLVTEAILERVAKARVGTR